MRLSTLGLLRTLYVVVAALSAATALPRLGVPAPWVPDLVLLAVVATALVRGSVHGALVGLASGWVVDLVPPVGRPMGLMAITLMVCGAVAGAFHTASARSALRPLVALIAAALVAIAGRAASAVVAEGDPDVGAALTGLAATVAAGLVVVPAFLALDRALVRRRLG